MTTWIVTAPRNDTYKEGVALLRWFRATDTKDWVLGMETGATGYQHWQIRFTNSCDFESVQRAFGARAHIEKAKKKTGQYERKSGRYIASDDRRTNRIQRFGELRPWQKEALKRIQEQNDRQIMVIINPRGNEGKSWLLGALWERGLAHVLYVESVASVIKDTASLYIDQGYRDIIVIDIPRTSKWTPEMYESLERIKDGLVRDPRYNNRTVNIRGVKIIVTTNYVPNVRKLTKDRWDVYLLENGELKQGGELKE